ncbi:30S ribosomal protein S14 [Candidatus Vidania fulgoroideorum]
MSKKSILQREKKKNKIFLKYIKIKKKIKEKILNETSFLNRRKLNFYLQKLPRNSNVNRLRNRCLLTGRPRGYVKKFCYSRIILRKKINLGEISGFIKSSW